MIGMLPQFVFPISHHWVSSSRIIPEMSWLRELTCISSYSQLYSQLLFVSEWGKPLLLWPDELDDGATDTSWTGRRKGNDENQPLCTQHQYIGCMRFSQCDYTDYRDKMLIARARCTVKFRTTIRTNCFCIHFVLCVGLSLLSEFLGVGDSTYPAWWYRMSRCLWTVLSQHDEKIFRHNCWPPLWTHTWWPDTTGKMFDFGL